MPLELADGGVDGGNPFTTFPYAIILRCSPDDDTLTDYAVHELVEAATDPFIDGFFDDDASFSKVFYDEVGDLCLYEPQALAETFVVPRIWSNVSAKAGHNPCAPIPPGEVYFNAAPAKQSTKLAVGQSATLEIDAYSEGPTADWSISAVDYEGQSSGDPVLALSLDKTTVNNGTKAILSITALKQPASGSAFFIIESTDGSVFRQWPARVIF